MTEQWKSIANYPNYEISNCGRFRNAKTGKILKANPGHFGYLRARIYNENGVWCVGVHRLVAMHFIPNDQNKPHVNHIDGNKKNNNVSNLEWATPSENMRHAYDTGIKKGHAARSRDNPLSKKVGMFDLDGNLIRTFYCVKDVERECGYFVSNIVNVCNGKKKTSHGYKWAYM